MSETSHVERLRKQGEKLALINKRCRGFPRDQIDQRTGTSKYTTCVKREAKKVFGDKNEL